MFLKIWTSASFRRTICGLSRRAARLPSSTRQSTFLRGASARKNSTCTASPSNCAPCWPTRFAASAAPKSSRAGGAGAEAGEDLQFFPTRQKRSEAVDALLAHLGYGFESVMSIGDSTLDADMIRKAAVGVAVGNAQDHVKAVADYIAAPYDRNGVAEAIQKFILDA